MVDDWATPDWLMSIFSSWHDPCQLGQQHFAPDNLNGTWEILYGTGIYINPPYSDPKPWVEKAIRTHQRFKTPIVLLLKHDSSTQWYRMLKEAGARFLMIEGRLKFKAMDEKHRNENLSCSFPSVLAVLSWRKQGAENVTRMWDFLSSPFSQWIVITDVGIVGIIEIQLLILWRISNDQGQG